MRVLAVLFVLVSAVVAAEPVVWSESPNGGFLSVNSVQLNTSVTSLSGMRYAVVDLDGAGATNDVGRPMVPVFRRLVEVPFGADVTVSAEPGPVETRTLVLPLVPRQEPVPKSGPLPAFAMDRKAYAADVAQPELGARLVEVSEIRGHRVAVIDIFPVSYNPARGIITVARSMVVRLSWTGADFLRTQEQHRRYASPAFLGRLDGVVLGAERFALDAGPALPIGYLVIVPDAWQGNVAPLAEWRRRKGFNVFVRNLTQVGGGTASAVKAYIQDAYDNWPIPPSFVLLVGDVDKIGYFTGQGTGNPPTDLDFSLCAGADYFPDIDVSRASVASAAQLDSLVANIVGYEQQTLSGGTTWLKKQYFIASADAGNHQVAENTQAYVMGRIRPQGVVCDSLWLYYGSGTPITATVNGGRSWITYSGHGGENCWADPSPAFDVTAVHALTNTDLIPFVQTYACLAGNFASTSYPECFSESWIRNGRRGALAHMASSVTSYWTEDDTLERREFDCMFDSTCTWIMGGVNKAKIKFFEQMGSGGTTRRYFEMYNLMGDGAIDVYSLEPEQLLVTHPPVIPIGAYPMTVAVQASGSPVAGALVCASGRTDTSVFVTGYTDANGEVLLNIITSVPDSILVTVTGHNLAPYLGVALALPTSGSYVMYLKHTIDDSAGGNHDRIINPGETINLPVWLRNWGNSQATNVRAWLRTSDSNITLLDTLRSFGSIPAGDSAFSGVSGFRFSVAQSCTNGYSLRLTLVTKDVNDSTWSSPLTLLVGTPCLAYASCQADDPPPGGNGNGMIDPGEIGDVLVTLRNVGMGNAYGVTATLRSTDSRFEVLDSLGSFGDIPGDTTGMNNGDRFRVRADAAIPRETQIPCTLVVRSGATITTLDFAIAVGAIRTCDPIPDGPPVPSRYYAYDITDVGYTEAPVFSWVEVSGVGTRLSLGDEETRQVSLPTGFGPFRYYGQSFSDVSVCSNGWISPGLTTSTTYSNAPLPDSTAPGLIALCWNDIYPVIGGGVWWYHDSVNHRLVVEWDSIPYYHSQGTFDSYEVIIYDTTVHTETGDNVVLVQYLTANGYTANTIGMEDPQSQIGITYLNRGSYHRGAAPIVPGMAIKYTTNPPQARVSLEDPGNSVAVPTRLALLRTSPNPFRGRTVLTYAVPREMKLALAVYDPSGRRVANLFRGLAQPGIHTAIWNGRDERGRSVSQGVYFYRLEGEGVSLARKVVTVK
jgi:hypothetical protein